MKTIMRMTGVAGVLATVLSVYADTGSFSETLQPGTGSSVTLDAPLGVSTQTTLTVFSAAGSQALRAWTANQISDYGGNEDYGIRLNNATVTAEDVDGRTKITFAGGETFSRKMELYDGADLVINGGTFTNSLSFAAGPADSTLKTAEQTVTVKGGAKVQLLSRTNNFPSSWGNLTRLNVESGTVDFAHSGVAYPATTQFRIGSNAGSTGIVEVATGSTIRTTGYATFVYPAGAVQETEKSIAGFGPQMVFGGMDGVTSRAQHGVGILNLYGTAALGSGFRIGSPDSAINVYNGGKLSPGGNCTCEVLAGTLNFYEGSDSDIRMLNIGWTSGGGGGTGIVNVYGGNLRAIGNPETYRGLTMPAANDAKSRAELNLLGGNFETRRLAPNYKNKALYNKATGGMGWIRVVANGGSVSPFFSGDYASNTNHDPHVNNLFISGLDEAILGPKGLTVNVNGRYYNGGTWTNVRWPIGTTQDFTNMVDAVSGLETEGRLIITGDAAGEFYYNSLVSHHSVTELKGGTTFITNGANTASQKLIISGGRLAFSNDYNNVTVKDLVLGGANGAATIVTDGTGTLTATATLTVESLYVVFNGAGGMDPGTVYNVVRVAGDRAEELLPKVVGSAVTSGLPAGKAGKFTTVYADGYTTVKMQAVDPVTIPQTWAGETASWNTASNWTPDETPGIFSDLIFPGSAAVKAITVAQGGAAGSLAFDSSEGYTISGEKLTLVGMEASAAKAVTVSSGKHVIENRFRSTGPVSATVVSGAQMTLAGETEIPSLIKNGAGTFAVTNAGLATAGFTLNDGRLVIGPKTLGATPLTLTACTNTTLEIVNDTGVEQVFPHTLNFNAADNTQFVDLVIDGDITMPAFNKGNACWFKRGPGKLTLTGANKGMYTGQRGNQYGSVHHIDEDGRLQIAMEGGTQMHGNAEIIDGTVHIKGTGVGIGAGSSTCVAVGGHADKHSSTNAVLILEHVATAPTIFLVGSNNTTNEWGDVRRHVRVDLLDHTVVGVWQTANYGSFYPLGQNNGIGGGTEAAIDIEINYSGESTSGGSALALMMSYNRNSQSVITLTEGSKMFYKQLYGTGNATVNLRGASEIRCDEYYNNTHGNDSATELYFFKDGGHYMNNWSRINFNVSERSTLRAKRIALARADDSVILKNWTAEPGVLTLNFDDGIWRFGEAADVEVTVQCPMRKNVTINALAGGLEFQVPAGQTVLFNKDVNGAGGVKKTGAGRFEFGLDRVVGEFEISGDAITKATTNILEGAAGYTICCTGAVDVAEGTLAIREGAADPALAKVIVASGATLDLTAGTHTLAGVGGAGTVTNGTLANTAILLDPANPSAVPTFAATAALTGLTFVDLGYTEEHPIAQFPKDLLVARYEGAAPACTFKVRGTGLTGILGTFTAQNGEIRAAVAYSGFIMSFR